MCFYPSYCCSIMLYSPPTKFLIRMSKQHFTGLAPLWRLQRPMGTSHQLSPRFAPIWAPIHGQVCVPITCQKSCISQWKALIGRRSKSRDKHKASGAELIPNPDIKVQSWHCAHGRRGPPHTHTHTITTTSKKKGKIIVTFHALKSHKSLVLNAF